jgi:glycosyltransferase involved in cell wall biosynthesis
MEKLSIIIPAYNEAPTLQRLVEKILAVPFPIQYEIILVDDHSRDRTYEIARLLDRQDAAGRIKVLHNEMNRGKGYSILRGLEQAQGDVIVVQDADFEYDPAELPGLLKPLLAGDAAVVYGSRFLGSARPRGMAFANCLANRFLTWLTNLLFGTRLTDMETCYKIIPSDLMKSLHLSARRFDFEPEITAKLAKKNIRITELPICYSGRTASEGKKIKARDFFMALLVLFKNRMRS